MVVIGGGNKGRDIIDEGEVCKDYAKTVSGAHLGSDLAKVAVGAIHRRAGRWVLRNRTRLYWAAELLRGARWRMAQCFLFLLLSLVVLLLFVLLLVTVLLLTLFIMMVLVMLPTLLLLLLVVVAVAL